MRICQYESHDFRRRPGHRLRPLTDHMPKALVPVAGKPMLERVILRLKEAGFNEITVQYPPLGSRLSTSSVPTTTSARRFTSATNAACCSTPEEASKRHAPFWTDKNLFLVHNADILTDIDLAGLYRHHLESDAESTLLVSERKTSRYLLFDDDYHLHGWINKSTGEVKPAASTTGKRSTGNSPSEESMSSHPPSSA